VIFWAGVNSNRKNLDALLRAAAPVLKAHEDAYLLLHVAYDDITGVDVFDIGQQIGLPPAQYAVNKGPANRRGIEDGRLRQYYAISTVCACSSIGEGNWLPGYEAQACGCVPIGPRFSAIPETIGSRGILVPTAYEGYVGEFGYVRAWVNVEKFTEELEGLYDDWKSNDSQRIRDMRARGRQWAERHTWDKFADAVTKLITTPKDRSKDPSRARTWVKEKVSMTSETLAMCCPTFTQNCGIAHYSESLVDALHDNGIHMKTFATKEPQRLAEGAIEQGFSLVHLQHEYSFYEKAKLQFFYRALADAGIASVTTMHTTMRDEAVSWPVLEGSSVVLVHSAVQKQMLLDMVPEAENVRIMPMGAPFMQLRSRKRLRLSLGYHEDDFVLGSYGFLRDQKGFDVLLNTVVRMEASVRLFIFSSPHLFGSPDYDERFMRTIEEMGLTDRVLLLREQLKTKSEVCNLLSVADVLVLAYCDPPDYCGVSSAAKDCAAAGRPLVLTDSSAFSDFKENEAIRVPQNDHEPVIAAVKMLRGDAELREKLAHAARQHAWEHRWDHVGKLHAELYQSVLEGSE
jgi:glycosyltransferase involved in cell wall biosynthesis